MVRRKRSPELREDHLDSPDQRVTAPDVDEAVFLDIFVLNFHSHNLQSPNLQMDKLLSTTLTSPEWSTAL